MSTSAEVERLARRARGKVVQNDRWLTVLGRAGLVAQGASYALVGVLALQLALGEGGKATSRGGALATIAREPWGKALLALLALGFASYAGWRFAQAFFDEEHEGTGVKGLRKRAGYFGRGVVYAALTFTAVKILVGAGGEESQTSQARKATGTVLDWPAGKWLVGIAGACVVGAGLYSGYRALTTKFLDDWNTGEMSSSAKRWGTRAGVVGLLARMVVFGLIGIFAIKAAAEHDPKEAIGLDGALRELAGESHGPWLLGAVASGLLAFAIFSFVEARYRDV